MSRTDDELTPRDSADSARSDNDDTIEIPGVGEVTVLVGSKDAHRIHEPDVKGWLTAKEDAPGALPRGTRIMKTSDVRGEVAPYGTLGTVLGSWELPEEALGTEMFQHARFAYFVEWDTMPGVPVMVADRPGRIAPVTQDTARDSSQH